MATPRASLAVLLTLCAWPVPAGAEAPRRAARLEITATPPLLRLREGGSALIRFTTGGEPPIISANVGRLEGLRSLSGGLFEADYIPPAQIEPQVALITVFTSRGFGWLALPLVGARELAVPSTFVVIDRSRLEASAAGAVVVRTIALSERSRPIPGARPRLEATEGTLSQPVELEPGVFEASWDLPPGPARQARVTAHFAKAPPVSVTLERVAGPPRAVVVEVDRSTVEAGDPNDLEVTGRVVDAAGNPADVAARLVVIVGTGAAARYLPEAVVSWQAKDAVYSGRVKIPARRDGDVLELRVIAAGGLEGSRIVAFVPGAPAAIRVEPGRELLADGRSRPLRVWFVDRNGNQADAPAPPHLSAARGSMGAPARRAPGVYEVDYRSLLAADDYSDAVTARGLRARIGRARLADGRCRARGLDSRAPRQLRARPRRAVVHLLARRRRARRRSHAPHPRRGHVHRDRRVARLAPAALERHGLARRRRGRGAQLEHGVHRGAAGPHGQRVGSRGARERRLGKAVGSRHPVRGAPARVAG